MLPTPSAPSSSEASSRRHLLKQWGRYGLAATAALSLPPLLQAAQSAADFIRGPAVPDYPLKRLSPRVSMVWTPDGFPTPENRGMMANITFIETSAGVVVVDTGASVQIGEMAIRRLRSFSSKPVVALINTHFHGDHFLGNQAFVDAFGKALPIYAHPFSRQHIQGAAGNMWRSMMERWTNGASAGTELVVPTHTAVHGQELRFGDTLLRIHHYGVAHTPGDICVEVMPDQVVMVGDVAMNRRIANMDEGSYLGSLKTMTELTRNTQAKLWVPGHGDASPTLLVEQSELFEGIYRPCEQAVKAGQDEAAAKARVLADPRVAKHAKHTQGWDGNIGKYISLAYLEAEKEAF
ncbi:MBL fold metallo-hydrolase [Ideonella sp.]|jgi:glyoxylase-like metal-dependent hydrolase (beta-lactamase superfamily II)|uniref:MBL fold metallo-hydrolase n=1 Tax=Ideonella sp. TaxID=1929293 RepID=UPI0037C05E23